MRHSIVSVGVVHVSASERVSITVFWVRVLISVSVLKTTRHSAWKLSIGEQKHHHRVPCPLETSTPFLSVPFFSLSCFTLKQRWHDAAKPLKWREGGWRSFWRLSFSSRLSDIQVFSICPILSYPNSSDKGKQSSHFLVSRAFKMKWMFVILFLL